MLTTKEAADQLGISVRRVVGLISEGKIEAQRVGRDYVIEPRVLAAVKVYGKPGRPRKPKNEDKEMASRKVKGKSE